MKPKKTSDVDLSSIKISEKLNRLSKTILFPEKVEEANHTLTSTPLPKAWREKK